jgi:uncharacterized protein (TIGR00297 family)
LRVSYPQIGLGFALGIGIALAAYAAGSLSRSGATAAAVVGGVTFGFGGLAGTVMLLLFFVSSSALSRVGGERKRQVASAFAKGGRRDAGQVAANGGLAALLAALFGLTRNPVWLVASAGAWAAVNADTWATELGVLARSLPRLVTTGQPVPAGTSGAISRDGTLAAAAGAILLGGAGALLLRQPWVLPAAGLGGLAGALADSLLGATVQAIYHCPSCDKETEKHPAHTCGTTTRLQRGWPWLGNDLVNFAASVVGAAVTAGVWLALAGPA